MRAGGRRLGALSPCVHRQPWSAVVIVGPTRRPSNQSIRSITACIRPNPNIHLPQQPNTQTPPGSPTPTHHHPMGAAASTALHSCLGGTGSAPCHSSQRKRGRFHAEGACGGVVCRSIQPIHTSPTPNAQREKQTQWGTGPSCYPPGTTTTTTTRRGRRGTAVGIPAARRRGRGATTSARGPCRRRSLPSPSRRRGAWEGRDCVCM